MEVKNVSGAGRGVGIIRKSGFDTRRLIQETKRLVLHLPLQAAIGILFRLLFGLTQMGAFLLGLNHAGGLTIHKKHVVGRAIFGLVFPDGYPGSRGWVEQLYVLNHPSRLGQHSIDVLSGFLFGGHRVF